MGDQRIGRLARSSWDEQPVHGTETVGKSTRVESLEAPVPAARVETRGPDLTPIHIEGTLGNVKFKGALKFDSKNNGVTTLRVPGQTFGSKLEVGSIEGAMKTSMKGTQGSITAALLNEAFYLGTFPPPLENLQPKLTGKLLDTDGSLEGTKLVTVGLAIAEKLPDSLVPEWAREHYTLSLEVAVEISIVPTDLETLRDMRGMVDKAVDAGRELIKVKDQVLAKQSVIEKLAERRKALEALQKVNPKAFTRAAQSELATVTKQLRFWSSEMGLAEKRLVVVTKIFEGLHGRWIGALGKLSPLLTRFRGPLVEKLCVRLLPLLGKLVGKLFPFLLIVTTAIDLAYLAKFLIDLCQGRIHYVGLGGDYEPELLDWSTPGDGKVKDKDTGGGSSTTDSTSEPTPSDLEKAKAKLDAMGGPRTRLANALLHNGLEQSLEPRHFERLLAILSSVEVTGDDVDQLLKTVVPGMTPDAALAALEAYFRQRDAERKPVDRERTTDRTGDGSGDGDRTGSGTGERDRGDRTGTGGTGTGDTDRETGATRTVLSARIADYDTDKPFRGGSAVPWTARGNLATLVVARGPNGAPVTVTLTGKVTVVSGTIEFRPDNPGTHLVKTTERRWNAAQREYEIVEGEILLQVPAVVSKDAPRTRRKR